MDNTLLLFVILSIIITLIVIFPNTYISSNKSIENMNTEEIITDFNLLIDSEKSSKGSLKEEPKKEDVSEKFTLVSRQEKSSLMSDFAKSSWHMYTQSPFYFIKTHPDNPVFYEKPLYRKPYRYPVGYSSTYPINHFNLFEN